jgi:hypothetical protein
VAHYISGAEDADQHDTRPENQPKEGPSEFLLIVYWFCRENFGI